MKTLALILIIFCLFSCASVRQFAIPQITDDGEALADSIVTVVPYGLATTNQKMPGIKYRLCWRSLLFAPVVPYTALGQYLFEARKKQNFLVKAIVYVYDDNEL